MKYQEVWLIFLAGDVVLATAQRVCQLRRRWEKRLGLHDGLRAGRTMLFPGFVAYLVVRGYAVDQDCIGVRGRLWRRFLSGR